MTQRSGGALPRVEGASGTTAAPLPRSLVRIPGRPLDPALGLVLYVVPAYRAWAAIRCVLGAVLILVGSLVLLEKDPIFVGMVQITAAVAIPLGALLMLGSVRALRPSSCLVLASEGLDDRTGGPGPLLWSEIVRITGRARRRRSDKGSSLELVIEYRKGNGLARTHVIRATSTYNVELSLIEAIDEAWQDWARRGLEADPVRPTAPPRAPLHSRSA